MTAPTGTPTARIPVFRTAAVTVLVVVLVVAATLAARTDPAPAATQTAQAGALRLAGTHTFTGGDATTTWQLHPLDRDDNGDGDDDDDGVGEDGVATASGPTATFDLPARDDRATGYEVRRQQGATSRVEQVTVFPSDTVARFDDAHPDIGTYAVVPGTLSPATHLLMVLHGQGRNAEEYCESWTDWAARSDYVVLCPQFDDDDWDGSAGYNLGNVFAEDDGRGAVNPTDQWAFTVAEQLHRSTDAGFALDDSLFDVWGHSAGAQFAHRFVLFAPTAPVRYVIAANAGWYTAPDPGVDIPYGLRHPELDLGATVTREHLVLMRGQQDVERGDNVRTDPPAEAQGRTRYDRAGHAHATALDLDPGTNWQLLDVPGADHDQVAMSVAAQQFLDDARPGLPHTCPLPAEDVCP